MVLADSDGDSPGTRRAEDMRQPHPLLLPNNDENRNGTIWFLGKKINIILQGYRKRMVGFINLYKDSRVIFEMLHWYL